MEDASKAVPPTPPAQVDLYDASWGGDGPDEIVSVHREADDSWRHGSRVTQVFQRRSDATFWQAQYRLSADGETNELREGLAEIGQVYPRQKVITVYVEAE